jgi:hypothetical protein
LLALAAGLTLALAPSPALSAHRLNVTLLEPLTNAAMADWPLPAASVPDAAGDVNAMSSMSTAAAPAATLRAGWLAGPVTRPWLPT